MEIGELLRKIRGRDSLRTASEKTGLSHTYISLIEKGIDPRTKSALKPSPESLKAYSVGYNYPYEELMKAAEYLDDETVNKEIARRELREFLLDPNSTIDGQPIPNSLRQTILGYVDIVTAKGKDDS